MRRTVRRRAGWLLVAGVAASVAVLAATAEPALAAVVNISDGSKVLDVTRVYNEAVTLPDPVNIFTTTKDADDNGAFDTEAQSHVTGTTTIVIAVNTQSHHLAIRTGSASRVSTNAAQAAKDAFATAFKPSSNYTDAMIAALDSLKSAIPTATPRGNRAAPVRRARGGTGIGGLIFGALCLVGIVVIAIAAISMIRRRRAGGGPGFGPGGGYGGPGYGPGYGGPGYGPGYGGGGGGVSPWVAGGAGAVGGGLLGYELGKMEGEREERRREEYYDRNQGGNDGGGYNDGGGNWGGGGADGDFGGGGGDSGSSSGDSF